MRAGLLLALLAAPAAAQDLGTLRQETLKELFFGSAEGGIGLCLWAALDPDSAVASMMAVGWEVTDHGPGFQGYRMGPVEVIFSRDGRQCSVDVDTLGSDALTLALDTMLARGGYTAPLPDDVDPLTGCLQRNPAPGLSVVVTGPRDTGACDGDTSGGLLFLSYEVD